MLDLFFVALSCLALSCHSIDLKQYQELERKQPGVLFQDLDLLQLHNYPSLTKLFFLTPWNKKGFEFAIKYSEKIDYLSPCWYSLILDQRFRPAFQNQHNYDSYFMDNISTSRNRPKIVPRVYVQGTQHTFFQKIGSSQQSFNKAVDLIIQLITRKQFDGFVWDTPYNFFQRSRTSLNSLIVDFISAIRRRLPHDKLIFFNMGNPIDHMESLDMYNYNRLNINYLLIQNYDKRANYLTMLQKSIEWKMSYMPQVPLILMLPFFSVRQSNYEPISTQTAANALKLGIKSFRISQGMCLYGSPSRHRFYIPCFHYFKSAFEIAQNAQAGVGFWQGGNGLENYYKFL